MQLGFVREELILSCCVSRPVRNCGTRVATWKMEAPSVKPLHSPKRTGNFWHFINDGRNKIVNKGNCHVVFTWAVQIHFIFLTYIKHISTVKHFRNKKLMLTRSAFGSLMAPCHNIVINCYPYKVNLLQYFYKGYIF